MLKELRKYKKEAEKQGWRVEERGNKVFFYPPNKVLTPVIAHSTPSDHRWEANFLSEMRRRGYE